MFKGNPTGNLRGHHQSYIKKATFLAGNHNFLSIFPEAKSMNSELPSTKPLGSEILGWYRSWNSRNPDIRLFSVTSCTCNSFIKVMRDASSSFENHGGMLTGQVENRCWRLLNHVEAQIPKYLRANSRMASFVLLRLDILELWIPNKMHEHDGSQTVPAKALAEPTWFQDSEGAGDLRTEPRLIGLPGPSRQLLLDVPMAHSTATFGHWTEVIARRLCTWPLKWSHLSNLSVANSRAAAHCQDFFQAHCL